MTDAELVSIYFIVAGFLALGAAMPVATLIAFTCAMICTCLALTEPAEPPDESS